MEAQPHGGEGREEEEETLTAKNSSSPHRWSAPLRSAPRGAVGTLRYAVAAGALWAIGSAWATGIRESVRALFSDNALDVVLAEALGGDHHLVGSTLALVALGEVATPSRDPSRDPQRDPPSSRAGGAEAGA